jgi:UDP-2-acetamido-2,6-beta-L-arabino-hexul-4-ose reductase
MMKIGITGQSGFVGKHLTNFLYLQPNIEIIPFQKEFFEQENILATFVSQCDVVIHLAGMNRHNDSDVIYQTNIMLSEKLIIALKQSNSSAHVIFSSSTQEEKDNVYGNSKRIAREKIEQWANESQGIATGLVIPNVFGPFGKPLYNSVIATFCHQLAHGENPTIIQDGELKLIYVNKLVEEILNIINNKIVGRIEIPHQYQFKVSEILEKLRAYTDLYLNKGIFPNIDNPFGLDLFNTFRCYVPKEKYPFAFKKNVDDRGAFVEIVRANSSGQFSFSTTKPGITRGNHFHTRKAERFAVIKGKASIKIRKIDEKEVTEYIIDGEQPAFVDMPIWHTHNITNIGTEELITLFWINEPYNAEDSDTYFVNV